MAIDPQILSELKNALRIERLLDTAVALVNIPSPTCRAEKAADCLAEILRRDGFEVERPEAAWPESPAVVARFCAGRPGKTLQFDGHLDTVHLPFVGASVRDGILRGSGAADMKGGIASMVEAARILRDTRALPSGGILLTAHDLHESPWGDGRQLEALIDAGLVGDAALLPEYVNDRIPIIGRGLMVMEVAIRRDGIPIHEVLGGLEQPSVIQSGARLVQELADLNARVSQRSHPLAGRESVFVGCVSSGEIYNQSPVEFRLSGTRRWLPGRSVADVEAELRDLFRRIETQGNVRVEERLHLTRDAFQIDPTDPVIAAFQAAHSAVTGRTLPLGAKPFVDDGNTFSTRGRIASITHGPNGTGAHTVNEEISVGELSRAALVYAATAIAYCGE